MSYFNRGKIFFKNPELLTTTVYKLSLSYMLIWGKCKQTMLLCYDHLMHNLGVNYDHHNLVDFKV